jgi:uncharacterized protein
MNRDTGRTGLSESVLTRLQGIFAAQPAVDQVILYGSRATGTARRGSDIDLALRGRDLAYRDLAAIANQLDDLLLPYKIDLALEASIDNPALREHIEREGILLFAREGE